MSDILSRVFNTNAKGHPYELFLLIALSGVISQAVVQAVYVGMMKQVNEASLFVALFTFALMLFIYARGHAMPKHDEVPYLGAREKDDRQFCSDCGKSYVIRRSQDGFNSKTGAPKYTTSFGCPDGDPSKPTRAYTAYSKAGMSYGMFTMGPSVCWPDCDKTKATPLITPTCTHTTPDTSCVACLNVMVSNKAITLAEAKKILAA